MGQFSDGDIIYIYYEEEFYLYKILKVDEAASIFHVLAYEVQDYLPYGEEITDMAVKVFHAPVDIKAFDNAEILTKSKVTEYELQGYYEYVKQTQNPEVIADMVNQLYMDAYSLAKDGDFGDAIEKYTSAITLFPGFFQAIDNRAFCKMDLGLWNEAIEDFEMSLAVKPGTFLAEFSIGECYLNAGDYKKAKEQFEKALVIEPSSEIAMEFLKKAAAKE